MAKFNFLILISQGHFGKVDLDASARTVAPRQNTNRTKPNTQNVNDGFNFLTLQFKIVIFQIGLNIPRTIPRFYLGYQIIKR